MKYLYLLITLIIISCQSPYAPSSIPNNWFHEDFINSTPILLTNQFQFEDITTPAYTSGSFLIKARKDTFLCSAKHVLEPILNIIPKEKTADFNSSLKYWEVFSRKEHLSSDTIDIQDLVNTGISPRDIILFNLKPNQDYNIQPLTPRFTKIRARGRTLSYWMRRYRYHLQSENI